MVSAGNTAKKKQVCVQGAYCLMNGPRADQQAACVVVRHSEKTQWESEAQSKRFMPDETCLRADTRRGSMRKEHSH